MSLTSVRTRGGKEKQVVGHAELLPSIAARVAWGKKFAGRKVIHFIDNEAARNTLIKGSSPNLDNAWLAGDLRLNGMVLDTPGSSGPATT